MENQFNEMAKYVNKNKDLLDRLMDVLKRLDDRNLLRQGRGLYKKMKDWDEKMMQRKSLAYDDVENFPNKFIADYLFVLDELKGEIPLITEGISNWTKRLDEKWELLEQEIKQIHSEDLKDFNKELWNNGVGAIN